MPEETEAVASSASIDDKPGSSSAVAADSSDVVAEAKKLIGAGNRHLVMGDVVSAVNVFQEACGMLAERYGDTADECGEAFFLCGKSLLELARMENTVLGNALEGVPDESSEEAGEGEKTDSSNFESADNLDEKTRDELRIQVYDAMAEKKNDGEEGEVEPKEEKSNTEGEMEVDSKDDRAEEEDQSETAEVTDGEMETKAKDDSAAEKEGKGEIADGAATSPVKSIHNGGPESPVNVVEKASEDGAVKDCLKTSEEQNDNAKKPEEHEGDSKDNLVTAESTPEESEDKTKEDRDNMEEECEDDDDDDDDDDDNGEATAEDKESEEEVGNLQLAWEMLEVAKVIYKRKENKEDQLMAAQAYLKLGEVGAESGNYTAALDDFQDCLALQLKYLSPDSRLLAETHYQLGMTYCYTGQYSQAIQQYGNSVKVLESRVAMLQEIIDKAEGEHEAKEEKTELEEIKQLLPDIAEKVEDAKESQRTAGTASMAIQQTLAGASTSSASTSAFVENGGPSSSSAAFGASQVSVRSAADATASKSASDISHLVRKKRKTEDSPLKDTDAKKPKQETAVNGSGDSVSASNGNGVQEKEAQEPAKPSASMESSA
ncbi:hypothetical protein UPYG_G00031810 [Umbra pygmaea]|uniref:Nuclear autoantigenic sperm protein n=1 Tax=Umbra pygmaea TaxID=75934 RepID=A0ABD0YBY7_UMBPY